LPGDFYDHDERSHALVGRRTGRAFQLGAPITVRLAATQPLTGGLTFELVAGGSTFEDDAAVRRIAGDRRRQSPGRRPGKPPPRPGNRPKPGKSRGKRPNRH
jgi:ribonuclease R